jgi:hypothetical protein
MNANRTAAAPASIWSRMTPAQRRSWESRDRIRAAATAAANLGRAR